MLKEPASQGKDALSEDPSGDRSWHRIRPGSSCGSGEREIQGSPEAAVERVAAVPDCVPSSFPQTHVPYDRLLLFVVNHHFQELA